ncbi:MAG: sigma-70 family RNA polymerase sigma factor [Oscillospiraceae bacterium]|nr:sigma-70 family RNA polymerase sigma factor [Oscillospiraceae bacterium]
MYNQILKRHYAGILLYCCVRLQGDRYAAEDCTQEVFLALYRKFHEIDTTKDIRPWLYAAADREILAYRRRHPQTIDLESIPEPAETPAFAEPPAESILDRLPSKDRSLLEAYYSGADRVQLARKLGISVNTLYMRIWRIRERLLGNANNNKKGGGA